MSLFYFIYDMFDYMYTFGIKESSDITIHHTVILVLFWPSVFAINMVGLAVMGLIIEFNNVFLHSRRLLLWTGYSKDSKIYQINKYCNIVSFFILRVTILGYSLCVSILQAKSTISHSDNSFKKIYPDWFVSVLYLIIQIVNAVLFYRLVTSDFLANNKNNEKRKNNNNSCNAATAETSEETERFVN